MKKALLNVFCLTAVQASNAALPLIVFPFALGVVGDYYFSKLVVGEAMAVFLLALVLYSFEIDGVAALAGCDPKRERARLSTLLSGVVITRLALYLAGLPVLAAVAWLLDPQLLLPTLAWSLVALSYAIQPNFFHQGLSRNGVLAAASVLSRGGAIGATMWLVTDPSRYVLMPFCIGVCYVAGALFVLAYTFVHYRLSFRWPGWTHLCTSLVNGRYIFFGNLGVASYRDANVLLLAAIGSGSGAIALYSLAEKLVKSLQAAIRPLNQHFFPHAVRLAQEKGVSGRHVLAGLMRLTVPQQFALAAIVLALYALYPWARVHVALVRNIGNVEQVLPLVGLMCVGALCGVANFMLGSAGLNAMGERAYMFAGILVAGAASVATCIGAGLWLGAYGAALAFVAAEAALLVAILRKYLQLPRRELSWT